MLNATLMAYIIGPTNSGKSTLLEAIALDQPTWGRIEIGKAMRAKYPPSHFQGQCNPAHTAVEAWEMFTAARNKYRGDMCPVVVVDGQPRDMTQCHDILEENVPAFTRLFVHLYAPPDVLANRACTRDGGNPEKLRLSSARLTTDIPHLYNIISRIGSSGAFMCHVDTSRPDYSVKETIGLIQQFRYNDYMFKEIS